jgi:NADH:ubiquinone oxidoreductase subunit B-like Fe-S oxidoreductase
MGWEEKLPSGFLLSTVEKAAGYARARSVWPAFFGLACCAMDVVQTGGSRYDLARFGMERVSNTPRQADLMIQVAVGDGPLQVVLVFQPPAAVRGGVVASVIVCGGAA